MPDLQAPPSCTSQPAEPSDLVVYKLLRARCVLQQPEWTGPWGELSKHRSQRRALVRIKHRSQPRALVRIKHRSQRRALRKDKSVMWLLLFSYTVVSDSLRPHGLYSTRLLYPRDFPGQEYWSGLPFLSPGDPPGPGIKSTFSCVDRWILYHRAARQAQKCDDLTFKAPTCQENRFATDVSFLLLQKQVTTGLLAYNNTRLSPYSSGGQVCMRPAWVNTEVLAGLSGAFRGEAVSSPLQPLKTTCTP